MKIHKKTKERRTKNRPSKSQISWSDLSPSKTRNEFYKSLFCELDNELFWFYRFEFLTISNSFGEVKCSFCKLSYPTWKFCNFCAYVSQVSHSFKLYYLVSLIGNFLPLFSKYALHRNLASEILLYIYIYHDVIFILFDT